MTSTEEPDVVLVCGSRGLKCRPLVEAAVLAFAPDTIVVQGGAIGPDRWAASIAFERGLHVATMHPLWQQHGKAAGPLRNRAMLRLGITRVVAFWDGQSTGTRSTIELAGKAGIPVKIYNVDRQAQHVSPLTGRTRS
jgi:hypothetical protein